MKLISSILVCILAISRMANAEVVVKYDPIFFDPEFPTTLAIVGDINSRAALNFERAIEEFGVPNVLLLSSDGGLVNQALLISRRVRALGIDTLIPTQSGCYSACSLIFFGGPVRVADGRLGVHQISAESGDLRSGQISISDILDTLGDYNVPNELLVNMFRTPPDEMYILTEEEKVRYTFKAPSIENPATGEPPELRAVRFLTEYNEAWSEDNTIAIPRVMSMYDNSVEFYGKQISASSLQQEKNDFAERWPDRSYQVQGDSVSATCSGKICYVKGNVLWDARSRTRNAKSGGLAYFELTLIEKGNGFRIISENGRVLERF